jgi:hypothetical protein
MNIVDISSQYGTVYDRTLHTSLTLPYSGFDKIAIAQNDVVTADVINNAFNKLYDNYIQLYRYSNVASNVIPISSIGFIGALPNDPPTFTVSTEVQLLTSYTTTPVYSFEPTSTTETNTITSYDTVTQDITSFYTNSSTANYENLFYYSGKLDYLNLKKGWILQESNSNREPLNSKGVVQQGKLQPTKILPAPDIKDPFNGNKAWRLIEGKNPTFHGIGQNCAEVVRADNTYTVSIYAKAGERYVLGIAMDGSDWATFDLRTGSTLKVTNNGGFSLKNNFAYTEYVGNGWYKCIATITNKRLTGSPYQENFGFVIGTNLSDNLASISYAGDGQSGIYIYGPQLTFGTNTYPYMETTNVLLGAITLPQSKTVVSSQINPIVLPFTNSTKWVVPAGVTSVNMLIAGGGGGANYAGRAGAGGVAFEYSNYPVTPGQTISVTIGKGGQGGEAPLNATVYPVTFPVWSTFMNTYAVWVNPATDTLVNKLQTVTNYFYAPYTGNYTFEAQADNVLTWLVDGIEIIKTSDFASAVPKLAVVSLTQGYHVMQFNALNTPNPPGYNDWQYNPAGWAGTVKNTSNVIIWNTRRFNTIENTLGYTGGDTSFNTIVATGGQGGASTDRPGIYSPIAGGYQGGDGKYGVTGAGFGGGGASGPGNGGRGLDGGVVLSYNQIVISTQAVQTASFSVLPVAVTTETQIANVTQESKLIPVLLTETNTYVNYLSTVKYVTTAQVTPITLTNYTPSTTLKWYTTSDFLSSSQFLPLATTQYKNLDNIKTVTGGINYLTAPDRYIIFASTGTDIVVIAGNTDLTSTTVLLSTTTTSIFSNVYFQNITKLVLDPNTNYLYAVDSGANLIYQFNATGILSNDNILNNKLIFLNSIGGFGDYDGDSLFNNPLSLTIYNSNIYVLDSGNSCIKQYDINLNWLSTQRLFRDFNNNYPIDISVNNTGNIYVLTDNNKLISYSNNFTTKTITDLLAPVQGEYYKNIETSNVNGDIFYLISNQNVYKKFYSSIDDIIGSYIFYRFNVSAGEDIKAFIPLINTKDSDSNVIFSTYNDAGKFSMYCDNINLDTVLATNNFDIYSLDSIQIKVDEYVQNWVFNKSFAKLLSNHIRLRNLIFSRFLYEPDSRGNLAYRGTRYMMPDELGIITFDQKLINSIGCNEIFQNIIVNRVLKIIYDAQVSILDMLQADVQQAPDLNIPVIF